MAKLLRLGWLLGQLVAMTCSRIMVVRCFVRVRVIRHQAEGIQVGCDSFQHADHPRPVESNKLRLDIFIGPKIHNHVFATQAEEAKSPRATDGVASSAGTTTTVRKLCSEN